MSWLLLVSLRIARMSSVKAEKSTLLERNTRSQADSEITDTKKRGGREGEEAGGEIYSRKEKPDKNAGGWKGSE